MADEKKLTVLDNMPSRVVKANTTEAIAFIMDAVGKYEDFTNHNIVAPYDAKRGVSGFGQDEEGNLVFDPEIFPDDMEVMVSVLTRRGDGPNSSSVKAIVVSPVPTFDAILADEKGRDWLKKIVGTELNRNAVRVLRPDAAVISDVTLLDSLPKTLADYVTSSRGGASTLLEAFEEYWKPIKAALGKLSKAWKIANLSKKELKNAMSSKAYASQWYPTLEETKVGSLFEFALKAFKAEAEKGGKDGSIFDSWLNTRAEYVIDTDADEDDDEDDISLDSLTALMAAEATTEEAAATDAGDTEAEQGEAEAETQTEEAPAA